MAFVEFNDVRKVYKMGEVEVAACLLYTSRCV